MAPRMWSQLMLVVDDVERSSRFYCDVVGLESGHGGDEYEMLFHDGEMVMQLHHTDSDDHHGRLADPSAPLGNGVVVWFEVADFDAAVARARAAEAPVVRDVEVNPNAAQRELWLRDPDGFVVVLAGPSEYRPAQLTSIRPSAPPGPRTGWLARPSRGCTAWSCASHRGG
jgi:catechol 2,3-dioxygenase-like lactoylglutathione lyase family enzyme